ncbi:succinylglutamate desuccinylase/aspartoacylase family protein [Alteraurantiacibacter aquimixticola]|uniref:Succinylglutamate desuccinylase/aspartoacylase family protein n=1 Tax=Alteraurantiacibacter aquimixticola TaxID=2489173 RepID=A0A4T3F247_9SPHN|nr:succinylglutamate desuccinylase/aspartoacylase family protein [Alteraurantiacibacter aquimixticola]TIX51168.1 succinylglutamate desuccinylase/aspartoacylase family protein [Alteraurantiacibacter aquimixticola]
MVKRADFAIGSETVAPGTRKTIDLPVSVLSDHTPVTMSVHVIHGKQDGPTVFVSAGVHGDEIIGVEIVRRLLRAPNLDRLKGTLLVVPVVNTFGFISRSRYLPDRRDLNRMFPGKETGSLASRLAHIFTSEILSRAELGIDLHSAAIHRTNFPQVRVAPDNPVTQELAQVFGAPVILEAGIRDGSLRGAARAMGKNVLLFEAGEGLRYDEFSVRVGLMGILRILRHKGMISAKGIAKARQAPQYCASSKWIRAPFGGLLRTYKADGELVKKGDVLGSVTDPFGEKEDELLAPFDGVIVGRVVMPLVNEGDACFHLARVKSVAKAEGALDELSAQIADDPMFDEDEIL